MTTKELVLDYLLKNAGKSISGEEIASHAGISRNAVWKAVRELRKDGYDVSASTNRGYSLAESDLLSAQAIRAHLPSDSAAANTELIVYDTIDSTNKAAKELAISGAGHGTAVIADRQTAGRGRYSRSFYSPSGSGLYMSLILRPSLLQFDDPTAITAFAAVAVSDAIQAVTGKQAGIKWVNDLFLNGKKVCGILTEAVTDFESGNIEWIVLGIGTNVSGSVSPRNCAILQALFVRTVRPQACGTVCVPPSWNACCRRKCRRSARCLPPTAKS